MAWPDAWADGDTLTPASMNSQSITTFKGSAGVLSQLTVGAGSPNASSNSGVLVSAITTVTTIPSRPVGMFEVIGSSTASGSGSLQGVEGYTKHTAASGLSLALGAIGNVENNGTGTIDDGRAVQGGGWISGTGSVTTFRLFAGIPPAVTGSGRPGDLIGLSLLSGSANPWSGTTNNAILTDAPISLISSTASLPRAISGRVVLYANSTGSLVVQNGLVADNFDVADINATNVDTQRFSASTAAVGSFGYEGNILGTLQLCNADAAPYYYPTVTFNSTRSTLGAPVVGALEYWGRDSNNTAKRYTQLRSAISVVGSDGFFDFWCLSGGVEGTSVKIAQGIQVGSPTGGDKGAGTINCAADIYKNNTAYTSPDYVFETVYGVPSTMSAYAFLSLASVEAFTRTHYHLPGISREASGIFARTDTLLEKLEEAYLHLFDLDARVRSLESSCNTSCC